jgi:iron complex outermembrane receptor protein
MYLRIIFFVLLLGNCSVFSAQNLFQEDPVKLKEVQVVSTRLEDYAIGATVTRPDSTLIKMHQSESLPEMLTNTSGISLKTYGPGGLSSISMRGGLNDHTAILWNGLNIQSPMNGGMNLSVMPVSFFSDVKIQHGGSGTLFGSGAMSGVVHLSGGNLLKKPNEIKASFTSGSYGFGALQGGFKAGSKNFATRLSLFGQQSDNDYFFTNTSRITSPEEQQTNAGLQQYGILQENYWRISDHSLISTGLWFQYYDKDLQTLMTSRRPNDTNQTDRNLAVSLNYKNYKGPGTFTFKQGLIRNKIIYSDPDLADPQSDNNSLSWINEVEYKYRFGSVFSLNGGLNYTFETARSDGYVQKVIRNRISAFASLRAGFAGDKGVGVISLRDEMTDGTFQPAVFGAGAEYLLLKGLRLKGNMSRNYRIPNLNDLYWKEDGYAMGNPDLKAESGWSGDFGLTYSSSGNVIQWAFSTTYFASETQDLIIWLPGDNGKWMPVNKKEGRAQGIETGINADFEMGEVNMNSRLSYSFTESRLRTNDVYDGKQMVYVPTHKANFVSGINWRSINFSFAGRYVGERFYDHENTLDPYLAVDSSVGYSRKVGSVKANVSFKAANLTNTNYQVVAWYAMPPRNYKVSLTIII